MAIQKDIPTQFGDDDFASYWNIGEIHDDIRNGNLRVVMFGFKNNAARVAKRDPKTAANLNITGVAYKKNMTLAEIYAFIKADSANALADGADV